MSKKTISECYQIRISMTWFLSIMPGGAITYVKKINFSLFLKGILLTYMSCKNIHEKVLFSNTQFNFILITTVILKWQTPI